MGSPADCAGASDCAGCVGVALEVARMAIASRDMRLPVPLMLLLNGGEETVLTAAHGFMQSSKWADQVVHRSARCTWHDPARQSGIGWHVVLSCVLLTVPGEILLRLLGSAGVQSFHVWSLLQNAAADAQSYSGHGPVQIHDARIGRYLRGLLVCRLGCSSIWSLQTTYMVPA